MNRLKDITVMILAIGLMGLLALIVVDEFMMASEHGGDFDEGILGLLNNALVGVVGIVAGYVTGKSDK
jgi:putative copper export protein